MTSLCHRHSTKCRICESVACCFMRHSDIDREEDTRFCNYNNAWNSAIQHVNYDHFQQNRCNSAVPTVLSIAFKYANALPEYEIVTRRRKFYLIGDQPWKVIQKDMIEVAVDKINGDRLQALAAFLYISRHPDKKHWDSNRDNVRLDFKMMMEGGVHACLYYLENLTDCSCLKEKFPSRMFEPPKACCRRCRAWFNRDNAVVCQKCQ